MTINILSIDEIVSDPKVRGGRPVIAGTGITVMNIVGYHLYGDKLTPAEIADNFRLPLGQFMQRWPIIISTKRNWTNGSELKWKKRNNWWLNSNSKES